MSAPLRLAVFVSGSGRSLENMVLLARERKLDAEVVLVVSSSAKAGAVERASRLKLRCSVLETKGVSPADYAARAFALCDEARAELVCLAGWLKLLAPIPERFRGRVLNIHPALLPSFCGKGFYGDRVHEAVLASGVKVTGCTVHFCDDEFDHGPIVVQRTCPVFDQDDT